MIKRLTIRGRMTAWYLLSMTAILGAFGGATYLLMRVHLEEQFDEELAEEATELAEEFSRTTGSMESKFKRHFSEHGRFSFQVYDPEGKVIFGSPWLLSHKLPPVSWPDRVPFARTINVNLEHVGWHRLYLKTVQTRDRPLVIGVIAPHSRVTDELSSYVRILTAAAILALMIASGAGYFMTAKALAPVDGIARTAELIAANDGQGAVPIENPHDELGRLATTLNQTFARLRELIEHTRRFTADAAHEIRTPLSVMRAECELAFAQELDFAQREHARAIILEEIDRLSVLLDEMLTLSRLDEALAAPHRDAVFLRPLLMDVVESFHDWSNQKGVALSFDGLPDRAVIGDDVALCRLFSNLIDNAIKYTPAGGRVSVYGREVGRTITISIVDTGPGIDREHWQRIFDRFYRIPSTMTSSTSGSGLGLAICHGIATTHNAKITLDSTVGEGTEFKVTFSIGGPRAGTLTEDSPPPRELLENVPNYA